jgi:predicted N-acetyltransferase YhbS
MPGVKCIQTHIVTPGSPEIAICARWRVAEFSDVLKTSFEEECRSLEKLLADSIDDVALIARVDGVAAGTCLLVGSEIDPLHDVSPWLAGLYVTPEHRGMGVGSALIRAIEDNARLQGHGHLYLYTDGAQALYERLGWKPVERFNWKGFPTVLMQRDLAAA